MQGAKEFFTTLTTSVGVTTKTDYRNTHPSPRLTSLTENWEIIFCIMYVPPIDIPKPKSPKQILLFYPKTPEALFLDVSTVCHDPQTGVQTKVETPVCNIDKSMFI